MEFFRLRPQAAFGISFFFLSVFISYYDLAYVFVTVPFVVVFLVALTFALVKWRQANSDLKQSLVALLAFLLAPVAALSIGGCREYRAQNDAPSAGGVTVFAAVRTRLSSSGGYAQYLIDVRSVDGEEADFCASVSGYGLSLEGGDVISANASFSSVGSSYSDSDRYLRSRGVISEAELSGIRRVGRDSSVIYMIESIREAVNSRISACVGENAPLMRALVTGDRSGLDPALRRTFSELGISHLLAISGLHMGVLISAVAFSVRRFGRRKYFVIIPVILLYAAVSGFSSSAVRAGTMAVIFCVAELIGRRVDTVSVISLAVVIIITASPGAVYDTGFLLSVLCVISLAVLPAFRDTARSGRIVRAEKLALPRRLLRTAASGIAATVVVSIATLPVTARAFGTLSLISPISNLIFIPLFSLLVCFIPVLVITAFVPPLGAIVGGAVNLYAGFLIRPVAWFGAECDDFVVSLDYPFFGVLSVLLAVSLFLACISRRRGSFAVLTVLLSFAMVASAVSTELGRANEVSITFQAGAEGDLIAVTDGSSLYVIDSARPASSLCRRVEEMMRCACIPRIDTYVFTHYHTRSAAYLNRLLSDLHVDEVMLPLPQNEDERELCLDMAQIALDAGCVPRLLENGTTLGAVSLSESWRCELAGSSESEFVLSISLGDKSVTYLSSGFFDAGEAFRGEVQDMISDSIVIGSHGAKNQGAPTFDRMPESLTTLTDEDDMTVVWEKSE